MDNSDKSWDWLDWVIIFGFPLAMLLYILCNPFKGDDIIMSNEIIAALITGGFVLLGILVKHFFYGRKQYKDILKRLGKFENVSLEACIGNTSDCGSLTSQNGDTKEYGSLTSQNGDTKEYGSLTSQHNRINKSIYDLQATTDYLKDQSLIEQGRKEAVSKHGIDPNKAIDQITAMSEKILTLTNEHHNLANEIKQLRGTVLESRAKYIQSAAVTLHRSNGNWRLLNATHPGLSKQEQLEVAALNAALTAEQDADEWDGGER